MSYLCAYELYVAYAIMRTLFRQTIYRPDLLMDRY